ncbi:ABC transporter substrate-binding protein [Mesobacillus maritimus]|uniref:SgrR family transcriptional regulator n=1 Tax=Mesobacillus maritimus TaxID=1643336 RepID=A0ABS7KAY0_9BACI|nr:ABC transporter substrate-binding protein [Mesobacillus maritimus]MBY0099370.1 SgrR family transcriptional regulator [Mesobacillus maritimus]
MDHYLLSLYNHVDSGSVKLEDIANQLMLSTKQTRRKLQQWQEEGWLSFQSGRGRGNTSTIQWKRNVEQEYEQLFLQYLRDDAIKEVSKLLLLDWSVETKQRLMMAFQAKFGFHQEDQDRLMIPRFYPFLTVHPQHAADIQSANLVANLYNRVVTLHADNTITPELAHTWEYNDTSLILYLRKDVAFHDGSIMKAEDVVDSFLRMKNDEHYAALWEPITMVTSPAPLIVKVEFPSGCTYVLQLLSLLTASIFKEINGRLLGTGGFYLAEDSPEKTVLCAFKQYFGHRPLLDTVEFIQVPREFQIVYQGAHESGEVDTFEVESDSGFGVVVMNPYRSSDMMRKEVREFIHSIIAQHRHELSEVNTRIRGNHEGCLIGLSESYTLEVRPKPKMSGPIKMRYVNYTSETSHWLKDKLEQAGIQVEMEEVTFHDAIYNPQIHLDTDLFIHGEIFELNQTFYYFFFLKNSFSPLHLLIERDEHLHRELEAYNQIPFEEWNAQHLKIEEYLKNESLCIPLYYVKRHIPFSINLMNIEIKHFGYVDLTKLWTKPRI